MNPASLFQHAVAHNALEHIRQLAQGVQRQDGQGGKAAQAEGQGHATDPHEHAVKQKGDKGLSAGTQGEVGGVGEGLEGHHHSADQD